MNAFEVFQTVGIAPTRDFQEFRKAYIVKLKRLEAKALKAKEKGADVFIEVEDEILQLNEAFNLVTRDNIDSMAEQAYTIELEKKLVPKELHDALTYDSIETPSKSDIQGLLDSLEIKWEDRELDSVDEIITFNDFLKGTLILFEDNSKMTVPPGFLGVIARMVKDKIQFINIKPKDSVTFTYSGNGDLYLKSIPEDATFEEGTGNLEFALREKKFVLPLNNFEWDAKTFIWIGKGCGIVPFRGTRAGNVYISETDLKPSRNAEVTGRVIKYLKGKRQA